MRKNNKKAYESNRYCMVQGEAISIADLCGLLANPSWRRQSIRWEGNDDVWSGPLIGAAMFLSASHDDKLLSFPPGWLAHAFPLRRPSIRLPLFDAFLDVPGPVGN